MWPEGDNNESPVISSEGDITGRLLKMELNKGTLQATSEGWAL